MERMPRLWSQMAEIDYLAILEEAWEQHLAPRSENAPTVISTFAGCGGSSLGYSMAGFQELLAVEWDDNAVETFRLNFPDVPVYHGDIAKLSVDECLRLSGIGVGELDVFDGSPPCQGFSTAGKRVLTDDRNQLFREYVRLLKGLKPKVFVMENVPGMVKGKMKLIFAEVMRELKNTGYRVRCQKLNAKYFFVPQSRERLIFIGVRDDLCIEPSFPRAESGSINVRDADIDRFAGFQLTHTAALIVSKMKPGDKGKQFSRRCGNEFYRLDNSKPSPTILKNFRLSGAMGMVYHKKDKHLDIESCKRLGSFPDKFMMTGTISQQWGNIGNSVPPLFMRSIAQYIQNTILIKISETSNKSRL